MALKAMVGSVETVVVFMGIEFHRELLALFFPLDAFKRTIS